MSPVAMFDLDGVLADFVGVFHPFAETVDARPYPTPTIYDFASEQWGWTRARFLEMLETFAAAGRFLDCDVADGAADAVWQLLDNGVGVCLYTARPVAATADTETWVAAAFGGHPALTVEVRPGPKHGGHRFVAAVDDHTSNVESLTLSGCPSAVLFSQPWNTGADLPVVSSLDQFVRLALSSAGTAAT